MLRDSFVNTEIMIDTQTETETCRVTKRKPMTDNTSTMEKDIERKETLGNNRGTLTCKPGNKRNPRTEA